MGTSSPSNVLLVWESPRQEPPVCAVGVAGDFLPYRLAPPEGGSWAGMAEALRPYFDDLAVTLVNLEGPVAVEGLPPRAKLGLGHNLSAPQEALDYLAALRATVVGLANNHTYDYGPEGLRRTRQAAQERGMVALGAGRTLAEEPEVYLWQGPGAVRVGFWAAAKSAVEFATAAAPGLEVAMVERARQALQTLRARGATACIALLHAGAEHTNYPDPEDVRLMDALAAGGFDVVAACHSHRISGHAIHPGGQGGRAAFSFYGLGSLSSGIPYTDLEREGLLVAVGLDARGAVARVEVRPIYLAGPGWGSVPSPEAAQAILARFRRVSSEIADGSYRGRFYGDVSQGLLRTQARDILTAYRQGGLRGVLGKFRRLRMRHVRRLVHRLLR